jgi:hypothetical protein
VELPRWLRWLEPLTPASLGIGIGLPLLLLAVIGEGMWRWWRKERN